MSKTILLTGATDGIGLATAKMLAEGGHHLLLHGRNPKKLADVAETLVGSGGPVETFVADLSRLEDVEELAKAVAGAHEHLDVMINNAGIFKTPQPTTPDGMDVRFVVNALAPYLLSKRLMARMTASGRVVNLSSAAQADVNLDALAGRKMLGDDFAAYAQSKLALTMWSNHLAANRNANDPSFIAVNPGSLLASKMVEEAFGQSRGSVEIGADVLVRAALSDAFDDANGKYFDNDRGNFGPPHSDAINPQKNKQLTEAVEAVLSERLGSITSPRGDIK